VPSGAAKIVILVEDLEATLALLHDVMGLGPVVRFEADGAQAGPGLGWAADVGVVRGAILGSVPGMLELVEIPAQLRGQVAPGVTVVSFAARDVEGRAAAAEAAGFEVRGPLPLPGVDGSLSTVAQVAVPGTTFELIRFGSPA
jgi:catechol 2,3-dioxygenase-like lactoylglutathione lyase family enzyme